MSSNASVKPETSDFFASLRSVEVRPQGGTPVFPFDGRDRRAAEQYRIIRTKIMQHPARPRMLTVSSAQVGDGKSVTSVNLAYALALKLEANVLLVDADFRRSTLAELMGVPDRPGLAETLSERLPLQEAVVRLETLPHLCFLPSGQPPDNPTELLDSARWRHLCSELRARFQYVLIDVPPVGLVADFALIQETSDGVVLVVRPDHTSRPACLAAIESIPPDKLIGIVTNAVADEWLNRRAGYGYGYYDYPSRSGKEAPPKTALSLLTPDREGP